MCHLSHDFVLICTMQQQPQPSENAIAPDSPRNAGKNTQLGVIEYPVLFVSHAVHSYALQLTRIHIYPVQFTCSKPCFSLFQLDRTALQWAAANGHLQIIQILIEAGADIEAQDKVSKDI